MIADAAGAATVGGAVAAGAWLFEPDDFHLPVMVGSLGFTSYVLTAPIVHFAHGNISRGLLSGTARVLAPAIVAATAVTFRGLEEREDGYDSTFAAGLVVGGLAAIAIDWWLLVPADDEGRSTPPPLTPLASITRDRGVVGIAGSW